MGPPEESVESQHSYCSNDDKSWLSTTKIKYLTQIYMIDQNVYHLCFVASFVNVGSHESINNMIWSKCPKRVYVAKADLLFLFVNEMNFIAGL